MNEFARNTKKKHEKNKGKKHWQGVSWGELEGKWPSHTPAPLTALRDIMCRDVW